MSYLRETFDKILTDDELFSVTPSSIVSGVDRKEISSLSQSESERMTRAFLEMMTPQRRGVESDYSRICSLHGFPLDYCVHGRDSFGIWHTLYLSVFEISLRRADLRAGGDGNIALSYWDWGRGRVPSWVSDNFSRLPKTAYPRGAERVRDLSHRSERSVISGSSRSLRSTLQEGNHFNFVVSGRSRLQSLEALHNELHVSLGRPMNDISYAAFDPIFWLHHCNVDRAYISYLTYNFDLTQVRELMNPGERLRPFTKGGFSEGYTVISALRDFYLKNLSVSYSQLIPIPRAMTNSPLSLTLKGVDVKILGGFTYEVKVYITGKDASKVKSLEDDYAGSFRIVGRSTQCTNCKTRETYDLSLNVEQFMQYKGYEPSSSKVWLVALKTLEDGSEVQVSFKTLGCKKPSFSEAHISSLKYELERGSSGSQVLKFQKLLKAQGHYSGKLDGEFGPVTEDSVKRIQYLLGDTPLKGSEGVVNDNLLSRIKSPRCITVDSESVQLKRGGKYTYEIISPPSYLDGEAISEETKEAFDKWCAVTGSLWTPSQTPGLSDVKISWRDLDGAGGMLALTEGKSITFDLSDKWLTLDQEGKLGKLYFPVLLHEIGHLLGLGHTKGGIMSPFYDPLRREVDL
jgi:hypothetical protein